MPRFTKLVPIDDWRSTLIQVAKRIGTLDFSIVYRFYSTRYSIPFYVGRSDTPLVRESTHWSDLDRFHQHRWLGRRISFVDFAIFCGRRRQRSAFEQECRSYHYDINNLANLNHPAGPAKWLCPICQ